MLHTYSLERAARYFPGRPALVRDGSRSTFRELHGRVGGLASALTQIGFTSGDRLAFLLPNGPEYIELLYACHWLGLIAVPLNTRLATAELDHVLRDAAPHGLIRHSSLPAPTAEVPWQVVLDREPIAAAAGAPPDPIHDPQAIAVLLYTSGTTGRPKGVVITHAALLANVHHMNYWIHDWADGVHLHAAPLFHIIDYPFLIAAPALGLCQAAVPKFTPSGFLETVEREAVTHTVLVPTMINLLTQSPEIGKANLGSLRVMAYGGSPMTPDLIRRTRQLLPKVKLVQGYGLSESGFLTGLQDHEHTDARLASCGRACPGVDVRVEDESGREVEVGRSGELVARGGNVMGGYWNQPDADAAAFRNGRFRTGDIGYQDAEGFFFILDRLKDMIVTGGENVYSGEVETVLYEHPGVREAAVFGIPDPAWGELVTACVVAKPGATLTADALVAHCRRSLAHYKIPRRIELSETELPKSGSGKILKRLLRERFSPVRESGRHAP
jgi:long-chain acyl-CoA synthetase